MKDTYGRTIDYMRISITDRCNLRCKYCMPEDMEKIVMEDLLTYEEIEQICRQAAVLGITKYKITGGEPLVRKGCPQLVQKIKEIPQVEQVTLTTNGVFLKKYLKELALAGLDGVNVSLDTLNPQTYKKITGFDQMNSVVDAIMETLHYPICTKINTVLQKSVNMDDWEDLLMLAKEYPIDLRFIEMMPIGFGKRYQSISNKELFSAIRQKYPNIEKEGHRDGNGPALYYRIPGFHGKIGMISPIHGKFCESCNRIRMTSTGQIKPCLCFEQSVSIREAARTSDEKRIREVLKKAIKMKPLQHCFDESQKITEHKNMIQIGG